MSTFGGASVAKKDIERVGPKTPFDNGRVRKRLKKNYCLSRCRRLCYQAFEIIHVGFEVREPVPEHEPVQVIVSLSYW